MESPWDTYRVSGLPPGPICSAGLASLEAAAQPARVSFRYFVSRNDGSYVFADTLAEHNRNVERWQKRPWRAARYGRPAAPRKARRVRRRELGRSNFDIDSSRDPLWNSPQQLIDNRVLSVAALARVPCRRA